MDEWLCLSSPGRCWEVKLPLRTKSALCLCFCGISVVLTFGKMHNFIWCLWILTGLHEIACARWLEKLFPGCLIPPSPFYLGSIQHFTAWFLFAKTTTVKVQHLFSNFPGQHPVVVQRFLWRGWGLLPPCAAYLFLFLSVDKFIQRLNEYCRVYMHISIVCKSRCRASYDNIEVNCVALLDFLPLVWINWLISPWYID